jgi:arylsulfatase A-like enzyme
VVSYDYAPTIAEVAAVTREKLPAMDGRSFVTLLRGRPGKVRDLFWHYPHYSPQKGRPAAAIRNGDDKLILFFEEGRVELYNLKNDIGESNDLALTQPAKAAAMRKRLEEWLRTTGAQIPAKNPNYDPAREFEVGEPMGPITSK